VVEREMHRLSTRIDDKVREEIQAAAAKLQARWSHTFVGAHLVDDEKMFDRNMMKSLENVSTEELIERLKRSELGEKLLQNLGDGADRVFKELGTRWDHAGKAASASFRANSGKWATLVALLLALTMNIDSWFILDSYLNDRQLTASVVAQLDEIQAAADSTRVRMARTDSLLAVADSLPEGAGAIDWDELTESFAATSAAVNGLEDAGLPLGWGRYPHACAGRAASAAGRSCAQDMDRALWKWFLGILLTGLLAGLGAPFWYDAVNGITRAARAGRGGGTPAPPAGGGSASQVVVVNPNAPGAG
jgi:hypothetical protein